MLEEKQILNGLTSSEANRRLKQYGLNRLEKKNKISPYKIFLEQFNDFIIWVLMVATVISWYMGESGEAVTIIIIIVMNAFMGFIQEYKTEKSLEALKSMAAPTAKVIRDGKIKIINAETIVIGDMLVLESGDKIPADAIILNSNSVTVDESLLTGESVGVTKSNRDKENKIFMGTIVMSGKATARVIYTGMSTEMGKIADMLQNIEAEKSPIKEKLNSIGKVLVVLCIVICAIVTALGIMRGNNPMDMFLLGVSLAVAAIPEGLPAIVTVALALGVSRMLKRNALIRKLPAVETLGCTSIICSDKTGTLTQNKMTVKALYYNNRNISLENTSLTITQDNSMLKKIFVNCSDCSFDFEKKSVEQAVFGDPTETALIRVFFRDVMELKKYTLNSLREYEVPFDSSRKMMTVIMKENGVKICYVKGAPERIIERCKWILINGEVKVFTPDYKRQVEAAVEAMSNKALRCIAGAYKKDGITYSRSVEKDLVFVGVAGIIDPPRKEVKDAVLKCKIAGIKPVMITGDHKNTAFAIGKELNICKSMEEVITGEELDKLSDKELKSKIDKMSIFARVNPNHKLRIVKCFKSKNKIVAMTGDGVNDAPAVKEADIGIAMGISGTDVTKEAASMILLDDNFATIVASVEEGRVIYNNIRKFIRYLLSCNLGEVLTMFLASLYNLEVPLTAIQILLVNLATDGLPAIALGVDPPDGDIMNEKPRPKEEGVFARGLTEKIVLRGGLIGICTIMTFIVGKNYGYSLEKCRTMALSTLVLSQLIHVFECRSERKSIFEINPFTNPYLLGAVAISICMIVSVVYIPLFQGIFGTVALNAAQLLVVVFFSAIIAFINSMYLYITRK
ncbi:calcium-translocating P-type ATPase, PMCA-type [Clostridium sp. 19966]|uniref:calcium-translocating P-type ATPase, PMCA-type n=1 Tax=Clostridium sp. 19966 TaxID=2768166 RepID=UPI0028E02DC2|nr:calcium-translocating P-type ATPase, PMCA-type [Clostridium sp. 19966]MDT8716631.1 calcium-translocating P-type ATPase, PMCA-type [Clostridium sp. 19966]